MGRHTRLIANPSLPCCCERFLPTEAPSLHRHYPVSAVLWTSPRPQTARPASHEVPVDPVPAITAGASRVAPDLLCLHAVAITPAGPRGPVRSYYPPDFDLPRPIGGSAPASNCFEACSAFTHVTAYRLAESLLQPFPSEASGLRYLHRRSDCYRVERTSSRAGLSPAEDQRLSRRTNGSLLSWC